MTPSTRVTTSGLHVSFANFLYSELAVRWRSQVVGVCFFRRQSDSSVVKNIKKCTKKTYSTVLVRDEDGTFDGVKRVQQSDN
jgi:hypothetical protein